MVTVSTDTAIEGNLVALTAEWKSSIGASSSSSDVVTAAPVARLAATLACEVPASREGDALPPGWHCLFCLPAPSRDELQIDGLPLESFPIPVVPLPRRVFGGAKLTFVDPIRIGDEVFCLLRLANLEVKQGKAGLMVVATLERRYETKRGLSLIESQDIVHLGAAPPGDKRPVEGKPAEEGTWNQMVVPDSTMLFRYSALSFNSHRIHYDLPYAMDAEKLPALVVQGRLLSLLLLELARTNVPDWKITQYQYRSFRPLYCGKPFKISGAFEEEGIKLWAADSDGQLAQLASASNAQSGREL